MCGIVGVVSNAPVNQLIYDALLLLQHRGQDAAGIATQLGTRFFMHKARGMVRDVFRTRNMRALPGDAGLGQVRYPTAGNAFSEEEAQPFYVNAPFGIVMVHNGNLTNAQALKAEIFSADHRHINTESDSEVLLNVLAHELAQATDGHHLTHAHVFAAVQRVYARVRGSYAVIALIAGQGLLAFRDPHGIRPLCLGQGADGTTMVASESVALEGTGHVFQRDVAPGEAIFIDLKGRLHSQVCVAQARLEPCMFEFVYLARPDSTLDGISVYQARLNLGQTLAKRVISVVPPTDIDVVIPIPESSRPSATQLAHLLGLPYREGFVKNRYVGRTFIMPGQGVRKKSVRQKLNVIASEFKGRNVLLVDDSIVRGTTSREIVQMARDAGARRVYMASAAPPVRFP
ncbi:MAG: Amidophosphoribosyltransferase, partial [Pseudomonadota bacterium]